MDHYAFLGTALLPLLTGVVVAFLGVIFTVREGGSRFAAPFALMTAAAAVWLLGNGIARAADSLALAGWWMSVAHLGLIGFPVSFLWFTHKVAGPLPGPRRLFAAAGTLAALFGLLLDGAFIRDIVTGPHGYQVLYGVVGTAFAASYLITMVGAGAVYLRRLHDPQSRESVRQRARMLSLAAFIGAAFVLDMLPAHGVPVYVAGHWMLACFFLLTGYVSWRYRVSDITPAFVGAQIAETLRDALLVLDRDGVLRMCNPAANRLLGLRAGDPIGQPAEIVTGSTLFRDQIEPLVEGEDVPDLEFEHLDGTGRQRTLSVSASAIAEGGRAPRAFAFLLRDISERKKAEERIRELAYFDVLTGLPNRAECNNRLHQQLGAARRHGGALSLLFLDLDRFKRINDTLGHGAGDRLLGIVAERLSHCLRRDSKLRECNESYIARLSGDEFVICLSGVNDVPTVSLICDRIHSVLSQPVDLNGQEVFTGASIGISRFPQDGADAQTLLKHADTALYEAKDAGRNTYQFYNEALDANTRERLTLEADIRKALDLGEFVIHYQPLVDQRLGRIVGAEALLRWHHASRGEVPPHVFVPVAEDAGLIPVLGEWVLGEACRAARGWRELGHGDVHVSVNVSERQFRRKSLAQVVDAALEAAQLPAHCLALELTESIVMRDVDQTVSTLDALKRRGVSISIDDFGTGYSSLGYLKRFPIDVLKVDGTFTKGVAHNHNDAAITRAIISMARNLRLEVVAEGVEDAAQVAFLQAEGCHLMQGYLFGAPVPTATFERLLHAHNAVPGDAEVA